MLNEQKLNDRMMNLMESGFFGKKILNEGLNIKPGMKIALFQAAYNYLFGQNITVDGQTGPQTEAALESAKKKYASDNIDNKMFNVFYADFIDAIIKANNVKLGDKNNNRIIQVLLHLAGATTVVPDGIIGDKSKAALKQFLGVENIDATGIKLLADKANVNIDTTDLSFNGTGSSGTTPSKETPASSEGGIKAALNQYKITKGTWSMSGDLVSLEINVVDATGDKKLGNFTLPTGVKDKYFDFPGRKIGTWTFFNDIFTFKNEEGKVIYSEGNVVTTPSSNTQQDDGKIRAQFNVDLKKLTQIISTYQYKWGFYELSDSKIIFKDSLDDKTLLTSTFIPVNLQKDVAAKGGYWVYNNGVYTFKSKNSAKIFYNFKTS